MKRADTLRTMRNKERSEARARDIERREARSFIDAMRRVAALRGHGSVL